MRAIVLITGFYVLAQALSLAGADAACAEAGVKPGAAETAKTGPVKKGVPWESESANAADPDPAAKDTASEPKETASEPKARPAPDAAAPVSVGDAAATQEMPSESDAASAASAATAEPAPPLPPHPIVAIIRAKLSDPTVTKGAEPEDIAALQAFYRAHGAPPLWITEMGFSTKGQAVLFEIEEADDWGLEAEDFVLPQSDVLPPNDDAQAVAEIKLDLAILQYARFARGGRHAPPEISDLFDQTPLVRDPEIVMTEISAASAPDAYLQGLHPAHEQFDRLRQALVQAREAEKPKETDIRRLVINMERWRWMPEELGSLHVWLNTPEFMLYVVKDGEAVFEDKTLVGTIGYPTPIFTADMETIVFNPDWVAPPSVLKDKLWPALKRKHYNILKSNKLRVSYQGKPVDPRKINWSRVNIHKFTFRQKSGPKNVLGKAKFLYPNKHIVYMHDTLPYRRKIFDEEVRAIGYGCVRMEKPQRFAELMLAEDQELPKSRIKELWEKGVNSPVTMETKPPVHTTYFTAAVDEEGGVSTFKDIYGLDRKHAVTLFGDAKGFPRPPPEPKRATRSVAASTPSRGQSGGGFANSLGFGD